MSRDGLKDDEVYKKISADVDQAYQRQHAIAHATNHTGEEDLD